MATRATVTTPSAEPRLAAIVQVDLTMLRALLQLPVDAEIVHAWLNHDTPDVLRLQLQGAGWPVAYAHTIPIAPCGLINLTRHGKTRLNRVTADWQLPSHPGPITTLRARPAQRGYIDWAEVMAIGIVGLLVCLAWLGMCALKEHRCHRTAAAMGLPAQWSVGTGCLVQPKRGQWVPPKNYRWGADE